MKRNLIIIVFSLLIISGVYLLFKYKDNEEEEIMDSDKVIKLTVNNKEFDVLLEDNSTTKELLKKLENGPLIIKAHDYGNFEKVGALGFNLPSNDEKITTKVGDIVLYQNNTISLFYNSNTWEYTKIGSLQNIQKDELMNILGTGDVELKFWL